MRTAVAKFCLVLQRLLIQFSKPSHGHLDRSGGRDISHLTHKSRVFMTSHLWALSRNGQPVSRSRTQLFNNVLVLLRPPNELPNLSADVTFRTHADVIGA
jgi:hypothetical protein